MPGDPQPAQEAGGDGSSLATVLLGRAGGEGAVARWGQRLASAHLAYLTARQLQQHWRNWRNAQRYSVALYDGDVLYTPVQAWVLAHMPAEAQRAVLVRSERRDREQVAFDEPAPDDDDEPLVHLFFDGDRVQVVDIGGHDIHVGVERKDFGAAGSDSRSYRPAKITFGARTMAGRDAVVKWLRDMRRALATEGRHARLLTATQWGDWHSAKSVRPRPASTVVLPEGLLDDLVADLQRFYLQRERYRELGQPWHRGFLLHGPPGTGKTSTAQALASELDLDVYYLPLGDLKADLDMGRLLGAIGPRSMLLLEDVDVSHAATERDDTTGGLSASGLLNALDGMITPEGLVTVMTTNNRGALDEALLRPGRADREVELGYLTDDQFNRLAARLVGGQWGFEGITGQELTAAEVVEVVKRHLDDNQAAALAVVEWLAGKLGRDFDPHPLAMARVT
jgi:hypothetical protein